MVTPHEPERDDDPAHRSDPAVAEPSDDMGRADKVNGEQPQSQSATSPAEEPAADEAAAPHGGTVEHPVGEETAEHLREDESPA